ncbi:MAG: hypothetical protein ABII82_13050 [Verrucomicrobiota bacterium]
MKRYLLITLISCATASAGALPLANGGFEDGLAGWTLEGEGAGVLQVVPDAASIGAKGLRIHDESTGKWQLLSAPLPARAGAVYAMSYWARGRGEPGAINVSIFFHDAAGERLKSEKAERRYWPGVPVKTGPVWFDKAVAKAIAPVGAHTVQVAITPIMRKLRAADIDDIRLIEEIAGEVSPSRVDEWLSEIAAGPARGAPPPAIVLKLDDLKDRKGTVHPRWQRVVDFAHERRIKVDLGVVCDSLEGDKPAYFQWIKDQRATGRVGFWFHGWDHAEWREDGKRLFEFAGSSHEHQKKHFDDSQRLAREKLGFPFVAFGAPYNATDDTTIRVLGQDDDIQVWMYGPAGADAGKIVLGRSYSVNIEQPTFVADYEAFIEGYAHNRGAGYFVLQGHPMQWNDERFENFARIVDFLIGRKADFVFAEEFATNMDLKARTLAP